MSATMRESIPLTQWNSSTALWMVTRGSEPSLASKLKQKTSSLERSRKRKRPWTSCPTGRALKSAERKAMASVSTRALLSGSQGMKLKEILLEASRTYAARCCTTWQSW
eukprot:138291-Hanusia_phi.AAC.1